MLELKNIRPASLQELEDVIYWLAGEKCDNHGMYTEEDALWDARDQVLSSEVFVLEGVETPQQIPRTVKNLPKVLFRVSTYDPRSTELYVWNEKGSCFQYAKVYEV